MAATTTVLVRQFLQDIGRVELLSPEEDLTLARLVQARERLLACRDPADPPEASAAWAERVGFTLANLRRALHRGHRAKERMIQANLRLVVAVAKKYQPRLPLQHLRLLVDPPGNHPGDRQPERAIRLPVHITEKLNREQLHDNLEALLGEHGEGHSGCQRGSAW